MPVTPGAAALTDLLGDDAGLAALVGAGWRRAAQFSWDATVRATREVYRQGARLSGSGPQTGGNGFR